MHKIKKVKVSKLWGFRNIETNFNDNVNIIIGGNGTGKTTFITLIEAVITLDLKAILSVQFEKIEITLSSPSEIEKKTTHLGIEKKDNKISFRIDNSTTVLNLGNIERILRFYRPENTHPFANTGLEDFAKKIEQCVNVSWLSVSRDVLLNGRERIRKNRYEETFTNPVDEKISDLMTKLQEYHSNLKDEIAASSVRFQQKLFKTLLYNTEYDSTESIKSKDLNFDEDEVRKNLNEIFTDLDINMDNLIHQHLKALTKSVAAVRRSNESLTIDDVLPLSLLLRTNAIIKAYEDMKEINEEINSPLKKYTETLESFINNKSIKVADGNKILSIKPKDRDEYIPIEMLSSGEKQLIILLTETILQQKQRTIYIADEPELSLHISWQKKIISSVRNVNENAQIIVATHSPEIVGNWQSNAILMKEIIKDER